MASSHLDTLYIYMQIHVVDLDSNKYTYDVTPDDLLGVIRQKAATDAGMDVDDVNLKDANDVVLDKDFTSLDGHKIVHDDTLYMFEETSVMEIHVEDLEGKTHTYVVTPDTTISELKDKILSDTGIPKDQINLKEKITGVTTGTDNSATLDDYRIEHDDTLKLFYNIFVKDFDGTKTEFAVTPSTTIDELKDQIESDLGIPKAQINLKQVKDDAKVTDGSSDIESNGIVHLDTLYVYMQIHVVDLNGVKRTYDVKPSDMLGVIRQKTATDTTTDVTEVNLKDAKDVVLSSDFTDLDGNGIVHDDTLYMFFHIHVIDLAGKSYTYDVTPSTTISDVKDEVVKDTGSVKEPNPSQAQRG